MLHAELRPLIWAKLPPTPDCRQELVNRITSSRGFFPEELVVTNVVRGVYKREPRMLSTMITRRKRLAFHGRDLVLLTVIYVMHDSIDARRRNGIAGLKYFVTHFLLLKRSPVTHWCRESVLTHVRQGGVKGRGVLTRTPLGLTMELSRNHPFELTSQNFER